jgi:hypothetical protein
MARNASSLTLPPSYDSVMIPPQTHSIPCCNTNESPELGAASYVDDSVELPPPTYEEAMILFGDEKLFRVFMEEETNKPSNRYVLHKLSKSFLYWYFC